MEITQIEKSKDTRLLQGGIQSGYDWYQDLDVRQGYTHSGQFLGAGIGNGSNLYSLDLAWVKGLQKIGFRAERYAHNMDFFYWVIKDFRSAWVDMRGTLYGSIPVKKLCFILKSQALIIIIISTISKQKIPIISLQMVIILLI